MTNNRRRQSNLGRISTSQMAASRHVWSGVGDVRMRCSQDSERARFLSDITGNRGAVPASANATIT